MTGAISRWAEVKDWKYISWCVWINVINLRAGPFIFLRSIRAGDTRWVLQMKKYEGPSKNWPSRVTLPTVTFSVFLFSHKAQCSEILNEEDAQVTLYTDNRAWYCFKMIMLPVPIPEVILTHCKYVIMWMEAFSCVKCPQEPQVCCIALLGMLTCQHHQILHGLYGL